jgi:predicted DCC family thiol-disulfide oxidoreductase YuxK
MKKLIIFYDNWCPNCTRFINFIRQFNCLNLLEIKELRNNFHTKEYKSINYDLAIKQMASFDGKWYYGYESLFNIFLRIPIFWILIPFMLFRRITKLGDIIYNELALKRKIIPLHCDEESCLI